MTEEKNIKVEESILEKIHSINSIESIEVKTIKDVVINMLHPYSNSRDSLGLSKLFVPLGTLQYLAHNAYTVISRKVVLEGPGVFKAIVAVYSDGKIIAEEEAYATETEAAMADLSEGIQLSPSEMAKTRAERNALARLFPIPRFTLEERKYLEKTFEEMGFLTTEEPNPLVAAPVAEVSESETRNRPATATKTEANPEMTLEEAMATTLTLKRVKGKTVKDLLEDKSLEKILKFYQNPTPDGNIPSKEYEAVRIALEAASKEK